MTHHTSDSWPIYRVTCSISIKHITAPSLGTSPYNWGKIWTNHLLSLSTGKGGGRWFSCQRENNRIIAHTHQKHFKYKWRTHSHPLRQTQTVTVFVHWAFFVYWMFDIAIYFICMCVWVCRLLLTVSTPQASSCYWWLPCVVYSWWNLPFLWKMKGNPS